MPAFLVQDVALLWLAVDTFDIPWVHPRLVITHDGKHWGGNTSIVRAVGGLSMHSVLVGLPKDVTKRLHDEHEDVLNKNSKVLVT